MSITSTAAATASRSILGPLLETYTPSGICTNYGGATDTFLAYQGQGCSEGKLVDTASCWPPATTPAPAPPFTRWGFYSPGTVCPSGYASACGAGFANDAFATASSSIPEYNFEFPLIAGETAVGCCPIGFTCQGNDAQTCASTVSSGSYLAGFCPVTAAANTETLTSFQYVTVPGDNTVTFASDTSIATFADSVPTAVLFAPLFQINWQAKDLSTSSSATTDSTPTPPPASTPASTSSGLSTGAKVAIGVVVPVAVLAIAGALGLWLLRRRRRGQATPSEPVSMGTNGYQGESRPPPPPVKRSELDSAATRQEMEALRPELVGEGNHRPVAQELGT